MSAVVRWPTFLSISAVVEVGGGEGEKCGEDWRRSGGGFRKGMRGKDRFGGKEQLECTEDEKKKDLEASPPVRRRC